MNKYTIILPQNNDKELDIPIEMNFDLLDRADSLVEYEKKTIKEILNQEKDFEVSRFSHAEDLINNKTEINYEFYFAPTGATSANTVWDISYITQGFTPNEVYFYRQSFEKSFFKLDLYDSLDSATQKNYITIILPVQQGLTEYVYVGYKQQYIKKPKFVLDFLGDKEGFFIYWLKQRSFLDITTFYMTAKFFDAKTGNFIKMMNKPQSTLVGINKFRFEPEKYFYYKVILNYTNLTYRIFDVNTNVEIGSSTNPIKWYEYLNP